MIEVLKLKEDGFPEGAELCVRCENRAVILMDGQRICLSCGVPARDEDKHND